MEKSFELLVRQGDSVVAANAIARTIGERKRLLSPSDLFAFVDFAVDSDLRAKSIALKGIELISVEQKVALRDLTEKKAEAYIYWLSDFVLRRAIHGRNFPTDRGKTLLTELRRIGTTNTS